ncbi:universal stress protein [Streptomyces sp. NPDC002458]|uniref:universal stress protein n=1 Tax=Streptomyces sp. NPDC002458 TaxID=3364644 RepID=UPI0036A73ACF
MVVGVDGSESSLLAADRSADEALLHGSPLRLVYARRPGRTARRRPHPAVSGRRSASEGATP